ncbi:MAG: hypothetical protein IJU26_01895 [Synergistaceae bacterium]|nr:hypothetical protein [Synergistaceae bacterium]
MSKFTGGKWKIDSTLRRVSCPTVCEIRPETSNENIPPQSIAHIPLMSFGEGSISKQEAEANARLIAAAPEMYRLLKEELIPTSDYGGILSFAREVKIRAVLARIDGEEVLV